MQVRRVAITIGLALATVSEVRSQGTAPSREPSARALSSFESVYVPDAPDRGADPASGTQSTRLTREFREQLISQGQSRAPAPYPLPFYWTLVDSIPSATARTLVATAKPDPARRSGIVIEFADTDGKSVAVVRSSTIRAAMGVLNNLSRRTTEHQGGTRAVRPLGNYPIMHLSYHSPTGAQDEFGLLSKLTAAFRQRGPWNLVDALPEEGDPRREQTVQCFVWYVRGSLPTVVSLRCSVPRLGATPDHVLFMMGVSCRGCLSSDLVVTSSKTRAIAATDDLTRDVLEHVELEQRIYSPQLVDRSR